jgi:hypothetical protein
MKNIYLYLLLLLCFQSFGQIDAKIVRFTFDSNTNLTIGDIKTGIQSTDHNGWVKLDGRLKSSLTTTQQSQATSLGIGSNLPDATNSHLIQNGTTLGSVSGNNTKTIAQDQLPNVQLGGNTNTTGAHTHNVSVPYKIQDAPYGNNARTVWEFVTNINRVTDSQGDHSHTITTNSINGVCHSVEFDVRGKS